MCWENNFKKQLKQKTLKSFLVLSSQFYIRVWKFIQITSAFLEDIELLSNLLPTALHQLPPRS